MVFYSSLKLLVSLLLRHLYSSEFCLGPNNFFPIFLDMDRPRWGLMNCFPVIFVFTLLLLPVELLSPLGCQNCRHFSVFLEFSFKWWISCQAITLFGRICVRVLRFFDKCSIFRVSFSLDFWSELKLENGITLSAEVWKLG